MDAAGVNGQPAVHFNGLTDYLLVADDLSLQWGTGDFTVAAVLQHTTPIDAGLGYGAIYSKQAAPTPPYVGVSLWGNTGLDETTGLLAEISMAGGSEISTTPTGLNNGVPFVVVLNRTTAPDTGSLSVFVNGALAGTATSGSYGVDVSAAGEPVRIGGTMYGQDLLGDIAEVVAVKGTMSLTELQLLETYLMQKYGISAP
jgi:hypothetical protein